MAIFKTSVGGRTVEVSRVGSPGAPSKFQEYKIHATEAGVTTIDTIPISEVRSATYLIQMSAEGGHQFAELHLIHDDFSVYVTQTGETLIDQTVGTFRAEIVNTDVVLSCELLYPETFINYKKITLSNSGSPY